MSRDRLAADARRSSSAIRAPIRSSASSRPVRVGLTPMPGGGPREPGSERGRDEERRRRRSRRAPRSRAARAARPASPSIAAARAARARRRVSMRSVWSRVGTGSRRSSPPRRSRPASRTRSSPARSPPAARSRSRAARAPRPRAAAWPSVVSTARAHRAQRLGDAAHRPRAERLVADQLEPLPCWPASRPGKQPHRVPALPQSIGAAGARSPRGPTPGRAASSPSFSTSTPSARTARERRPVSAERPKPAIRRLAVGDRAEQQRAVRDRLVAGHGDAALNGGRRLDPHSPSTGENDHAVALGLEQRRPPAPRHSSPETSIVSTPPRSGEKCRSSKSSMLIRSAPM